MIIILIYIIYYFYLNVNYSKFPSYLLRCALIAKGFAADEVLNIYKKYDIKDGLIDLGSSSIYTLGKTENNNPWSIGIKHPRNETNRNYLGIIKISDEGLSTSSDYV